VHPVVAALPLEEKGLVLGALLARMAPEEAADRFGGATGERCRAALETLSAENRSGRTAALTALIALVRAPIPAGIERIHPGWLRERLAPESTPVICSVTDGLPAEVRRAAEELLGERGDKVESRAPALGAAGIAELRRVVFAGLVPVSGPAIPPASPVQPLLSLSFAALDEAIELRGAATLGTSLQGAPGTVIARAAAGLGGRRARAVLEAAAKAEPTEAREAARRLVAKAAAERAGAEKTAAEKTAAERTTDADLAWDLGARTLAAALVGEGAAALQAVAQRLSPERGRRWLAYAESHG